MVDGLWQRLHSVIVPIEAAGWRPPLWLGIEWRTTLLLIVLVLFSVLAKNIVLLVGAVTIAIALYMQFLQIAEDEPHFYELFAVTRGLMHVYLRVADIFSQIKAFPKSKSRL